MITTIIRRHGLGKTSTEGIVEASNSDISVVRSDKELPESNIYIRWGCTSTVPYKDKVINSSKAIHRVFDKAGFRQQCADVGIAPQTWPHGSRNPELGIHLMGGGVIYRPRTHAQGKHLYHCQSWEELEHAESKHPEGGYISVYVPKLAEMRVFVMQGRVVWMANKEIGDKSQIAWNHAQDGGAVFKNIRWGSWNPDVARVSRPAGFRNCRDWTDS